MTRDGDGVFLTTLLSETPNPGLQEKKMSTPDSYGTTGNSFDNLYLGYLTSDYM